MLMISLPVIFALVCTVSNTLLAMCGVYDPLHLMIRSHWLQIFGAREPFPRIILNMKQKQMWRINLATELFEIVDSDSDADGDSNDGGDGGNDDKDNNDGLGDLPWRGAIFPLGAFWAVIPVILCVAPPKNYLEDYGTMRTKDVEDKTLRTRLWGQATLRTGDIEYMRHWGQTFGIGYMVLSLGGWMYVGGFLCVLLVQSWEMYIFWEKNCQFLTMLKLLKIFCPQCCLSSLSHVLNVECPHCCMSSMSHVLNVACPQCRMSSMSHVLNVA